MIVDIQTRRLRTVGHRPLAVDLRAFVGGNEAVDFQPRDRDEAYGFVRDTPERFGYGHLGKHDDGMVLKFLVAAPPRRRGGRIAQADGAPTGRCRGWPSARSYGDSSRCSRIRGAIVPTTIDAQNPKSRAEASIRAPARGTSRRLGTPDRFRTNSPRRFPDLRCPPRHGILTTPPTRRDPPSPPSALA